MNLFKRIIIIFSIGLISIINIFADDFNQHLDYAQVIYVRAVKGANNLWTLPEDKKVGAWSYIPLNKRIEYIIDNVLESRKSGGFDLDDFLVVIFTQLKNGLTPEAKEIIEVLKKKADIKRNRWYLKEKRQLELFEKPVSISERENILNEDPYDFQY